MGISFGQKFEGWQSILQLTLINEHFSTSYFGGGSSEFQLSVNEMDFIEQLTLNTASVIPSS